MRPLCAKSGLQAAGAGTTEGIMHEITDMDTYYELLADRRAARIYEKTRARHHDPRDPDHPGPRFQETYCSQCGAELGPGDSGVSRCLDHINR